MIKRSDEIDTGSLGEIQHRPECVLRIEVIIFREINEGRICYAQDLKLLRPRCHVPDGWRFDEFQRETVIVTPRRKRLLKDLAVSRAPVENDDKPNPDSSQRKSESLCRPPNERFFIHESENRLGQSRTDTMGNGQIVFHATHSSNYESRLLRG